MSTGLARGGYPFVVSQGKPGVAYVAANGVYRSTDGGESWQPWSGGDLRADDDIYLVAGAVP